MTVQSPDTSRHNRRRQRLDAEEEASVKLPGRAFASEPEIGQKSVAKTTFTDR
jgi:hypothetical protein